jgi:phosphomannomutase
MDNKFWRNQNRSYVFDVDGTLSHARQPMDKEFHDWFVNWMSTRDVYLVTGSDRPKTVEQIGEDIVDGCNMSFQCAGNDVWRKGSPVAQTNFTPPPEMNDWLNNELKNSKYPNRWGNHIEKRVGLINFCVPGRNMPDEERDEYFHWDKAMGERLDIAERFNKEFPGFQAQVGGNTSLDIFMAGRNKAQVYNTIGSPMVFFGDRCESTGNDYPLVKMLKLYDRHHHVTGPEDTWNILKEKYDG